MSRFPRFGLGDPGLTHPSTSEVLIEVGPNGIGKSGILSQVYHAINLAPISMSNQLGTSKSPSVLSGFQIKGKSLYQARSGAPVTRSRSKISYYRSTIKKTKRWTQQPKKPMGYRKFARYFADHSLRKKDIPKMPTPNLAFVFPKLASERGSGPSLITVESVDSKSRRQG